MDFEIQIDHLILIRRPKLLLISKKKRLCPQVDIAVPTDHREKMKESEKINKNLDLDRELKTLRNRRMTEIPIVVGTFEMVTKVWKDWRNWKSDEELRLYRSQHC